MLAELLHHRSLCCHPAVFLFFSSADRFWLRLTFTLPATSCAIRRRGVEMWHAHRKFRRLVLASPWLEEGVVVHVHAEVKVAAVHAQAHLGVVHVEERVELVLGVHAGVLLGGDGGVVVKAW